MRVIDEELERRVRDIVAVVTTDIDAVTCEVEDRVAYIEGVVSSDWERRAIAETVAKLDGVDQVVACLATEHLVANVAERANQAFASATASRHFHSLS